MSTVEYCGDSTPHGIFKYWVRKTKHECAWEISRCWKRIKELENVLAQQQAYERELLHTIAERDRWEERATELAEAVGMKILHGEYIMKFDQQQEAEPVAWILTGADRDLVPRRYLLFSEREAELHVAQNLAEGEWQSCAANPLYLHPPKPAAQPQVPEGCPTDIEVREAVAREFTMRIPAEFDRDADLVMAEAASRLRSMSGQVAAGCDLESRNNNDRGKQNAS